MQEKLPIAKRCLVYDHIPNELDWGDVSGDFDAMDAYDIFFGHSNLEMQKEFAKNILSRAQDIRFMPSLPFMYYVIGFSDFVLSRKYGNESAADVANSFISVIYDKSESDLDALIPVFDKISNTLDFLVKNQKFFGASEDIYGNFDEKIRSIKHKVAQGCRLQKMDQ
jgi:hypothetical protein